MTLPEFIIIGAQKSGSTFVHYCLAEHPEIYVPHHEVHFFENPVYDPAKISQLVDLGQRRKDERRWGIKRADYLSRPECAQNISNHCPDAQIIVVLRNPVARLISAYFHFLNYGFIPVVEFNKGMSNILAGRYNAKYPAAMNLINYGFYFKHLSTYLKLFPPENVHVYLFDDLRTQPIQVLQQLFRLLAVDEAFVPPSLSARPQATLYSIPRLKFRSLRNRFVYTYDAERSRSYQKKNLSLTERSLNRLIKSVDIRILAKLFPTKKPDVSVELFKRLQAIYHDDVRSLESYLQRDLQSLGWP